MTDIVGAEFFSEPGTGTVVSASSATQVEREVRAAYGAAVLEASPAVLYRQRVVRDARFAVAETMIHGSLVAEADGLPFLVVVDLPRGTQTVHVGGERWRTEGAPFLFPLRRKRLAWADVHVRQTVLDLRAVDRELQDSGERPIAARPMRRTPVSSSVAQRWNAAAAHARAFAGSQAFVDAPLSRTAVFRLLAAALADAFTVRTEDRDGDVGATASRGQLGRALEFVVAQADQDITVSDIAAAAGVSVRALQRTFQRRLGIRPLTALRNERLRRAHDDLLAADRSSDETVRSVAARWGFTNAGRFAAAFAERYGELPSSTLDRS